MSVLDCSHYVRPTGINHQSWTFTAPPHWQRKRLRSLCKVNPSATTKLRTMAGSTEVSFLPMELAKAGSPELAPRTAALSDVRNGFTPFLDGDLLIAKITPCFENGKGGIADNLLNGIGFGSTEFHVLRPGPEIDARFLYYATMSEPFREIGVRMMRGSAGQQRVPVEFLNDFVMVFPDIRTQRLIAEFLDRYMRLTGSLIRAKRRQIELLNEQKQSIINKAVTRGLDPNMRLKPSGIEWLNSMPEHWEVWQIGHLAKVGNGSTPSRGNPAYWFGGTYPWLNSASVHQGRIIKAPQFVTDLALRECHLPKAPPGSVLVAITGQGKTRGTAAVLCIEATINQHLVHITPRGASVSPDYLQMYLSAAYSELRALSDDSGGTKGALTCHDMRHFRVALPPIDEQVRIVELVNHKTTSIERAVHHIRQETDLLLEYRTRLIADVVTGKLDVRDVELPNLEDADIAYDLGDSNFDSNDDQDDLPDAEEVEADDED